MSENPTPISKSTTGGGLFRWFGETMKILLAFATLLVTILGFMIVNSQLEWGWRQSQLGYLQERGQDFLAHEYESDDSLSCLYDWWFDDREPGAGKALAERCTTVKTDRKIYAKTMLYVEESLMHLVEEQRIRCDARVPYGREIDIWRRDISSDVSGAFSFYLVSRYSDPDMKIYFSQSLLPHETPTERVTTFVKMAQIPDLSIAKLCNNARRFKQGATIPLQLTNANVEQVCGGTPSDSLIYDYTTKDQDTMCGEMYSPPKRFLGIRLSQ